ncbi:MAG: Ig domain-containing protein, partial [Planctomycetaceae bacterium]
MFRIWKTGVAFGLGLLMAQGAGAEPAKPKGLGDPGQLTQLKVEPSLTDKGLLVKGRDARQQLFVTGVYSSGQMRDHTRKVSFSSEPGNIVKIDAQGLLTPVADGTTTVVATDPSGQKASLQVTVTGLTNDVAINFTNQIVPIFTKLGCNGGGCHGKASGQNGFKLSLLGFYPDEDYEFLVKEARGRRLSPSSPGQSLLLNKAVGRSPHGGGKRMEIDSYEYRIIARWI